MFLLPKNKVRIERNQHVYVNENAVRPPPGTQIYCGNLPRLMLESELFPYFSLIGEVYELRLMTDFSGFSRGYCFVTYTTEAHAEQAVRSLHGYILKDRQLCVYKSWNNTKLFIYDLPKDILPGKVSQELQAMFEGILNVSCHTGWALVEFDNQRNANTCRKKIWPRTLMSWGTTIRAEWAKPLPDDNHQLDSTIILQNVPTKFGKADVYSLIKTRIRTNALIEISKEFGSTVATLVFTTSQASAISLKCLIGLQYNGEALYARKQKLIPKKYGLHHSNMDPRILEEEGQRTYNIPQCSVDHITTTSRTKPKKLDKLMKPRHNEDTNDKSLFHRRWDPSQAAFENPNDRTKAKQLIPLSHNLSNSDIFTTNISTGIILNRKLDSHIGPVHSDYSFDDAYNQLFPDDPHYKPSTNPKFNIKERWQAAYQEVMLLFQENCNLREEPHFDKNV